MHLITEHLDFGTGEAPGTKRWKGIEKGRREKRRKGEKGRKGGSLEALNSEKAWFRWAQETHKQNAT